LLELVCLQTLWHSADRLRDPLEVDKPVAPAVHDHVLLMAIGMTEEAEKRLHLVPKRDPDFPKAITIIGRVSAAADLGIAAEHKPEPALAEESCRVPNGARRLVAS
jgi:hypothetical protein